MNARLTLKKEHWSFVTLGWAFCDMVFLGYGNSYVINTWDVFFQGLWFAAIFGAIFVTLKLLSQDATFKGLAKWGIFMAGTGAFILACNIAAFVGGRIDGVN